MSKPPIRVLLWKNQHGLCWICHEPMIFELRPPHPLGLTVDHIIPVSRGGSTKEVNKLLAHLDCNNAKADKHPLALSRGMKLRALRDQTISRLHLINVRRAALSEDASHD